MTPVGHAAIGSLIKEADPKGNKENGFWYLFGAIAPDMDFLAAPFFGINSVHRVFSHSFFFAFFLGGVLYFLHRKAWRGFLLGYLSHLLIDPMFDNYSANGIGTAMFWPLSTKVYNYGFTLNLGPHLSHWGGIRNTLLNFSIYELPFFLFALFLEIRRKFSKD